MPVHQFGDLAQHLSATRLNATLKERLMRLSGELSSGQADDLARQLSGRTDRLAEIDRRIGLTTTQAATSRALADRFAAMQVGLDAVDDHRAALSGELISAPLAPDEATLGRMATSARDAIAGMIGALNARHGADALFSGAATDRAPLAPAEEIISALRTVAAGATDAADLALRLDAWFDDPGGGFATLAYRGDTGPVVRQRLDADLRVDIGPRADDPAMRAVFKATAMAALADDPGLAMSAEGRAAVLRDAGLGLAAAGDALTGVRAVLGQRQEQTDRAVARLAAEGTALSIMRNDLVAVDPYDTATALQQVEAQLQTHYTVTARLAGLSLARYLA